MRRIAIKFKINRKTVARKLKFLGEQALISIAEYFEGKSFSNIQIDEMETYEHTKCKPLSIPLVIDASGRKIIGFDVAVMPATGHLAKRARKKYGYRPDRRKVSMEKLLENIKPHISLGTEIKTDMKTMYQTLIKKHFPHCLHKTYKGRKSSVSGQGELKKGGYDPIFAINHTAAMFRDNISYLIRKTWCHQKKLRIFFILLQFTLIIIIDS